MTQQRFKSCPASFRLRCFLHPRAWVNVCSPCSVFMCGTVELKVKPCFSWGASHSAPGCLVNNPRVGFAAPQPWDKLLPNSLSNECLLRFVLQCNFSFHTVYTCPCVYLRILLKENRWAESIHNHSICCSHIYVCAYTHKNNNTVLLWYSTVQIFFFFTSHPQREMMCSRFYCEMILGLQHSCNAMEKGRNNWDLLNILCLILLFLNLSSCTSNHRVFAAAAVSHAWCNCLIKHYLFA